MSTTFEQVVALCKGEVMVSANPHRSVYADKAAYLARLEDAPTGEELAQILAAPDLYEMQFYPNTPVGFYDVFGISLDDVARKSLAILAGLSREEGGQE